MAHQTLACMTEKVNSEVFSEKKISVISDVFLIRKLQVFSAITTNQQSIKKPGKIQW